MTEPRHPERTWFGHPRGLTVLFLTQMWAEFSFFGLQALLVYYMIQRLGLPQSTASLVYGIYGGSAFFTPVLGGYLSDQVLGRTRSIVAGGVLMMLGHFAMAFEPLFYPALALVALGNGLFLPALAVQVSGLYVEGDGRRASAFSLYYMGTNIGGLLSPIVCGTLGERFGWHWGFAAAGFGMLLGLTIFWGFRAYLPPDPIVGQIARHERMPLSIQDRASIRVLLMIGTIVILFRIGYEQSGNIIALWIQGQTDRHVELFGRVLEIPATWFQSINPLLIITLTPFLMRYWGKRAAHVETSDLMRRMGLGCIIATGASLVMVAAAWAYSMGGHAVSPWWIVAYFVLLTIGELHVLPVGLSLFGTLAPLQIASVVMGSWYIAKFLGSVLAGVMGMLWQRIPPEGFFGIGAATTLLAAVALYWMAPAPSRTATPAHSIARRTD